MSSIYLDIRRGLEQKLSQVSGIPSIAYENISFDPTTGTSWVRPTFIPTTRRPAVRGSNPQQLYLGIFRVDCFVAEGNGPSAGDTLANSIIEDFDATTDITFNSKTISIDYAEREEGRLSSPWYFIPVTIGWYVYN
jgi:hypothetical protein